MSICKGNFLEIEKPNCSHVVPSGKEYIIGGLTKGEVLLSVYLCHLSFFYSQHVFVYYFCGLHVFLQVNFLFKKKDISKASDLKL